MRFNRVAAAATIFVSVALASAAKAEEVLFSVSSAGHSVAVPGVRAELYLGSRQLADGVTDGQGNLTLDLPGPGDYRIVFRHDNCRPVTRNLSFPGANDEPIEVLLPATGTIEAIVHTTKGTGLAMGESVVVTVGRARDLRRSPKDWYRGAIAKPTDEDGRAVFCVEAGQPHDVIVKHSDYAHAARYGIIPPPDGTELVEIEIAKKVLSCPRMKGR